MGSRFTTTRWSRVLAARDGADAEAREALAVLCETYWYPLYAYVRRQGYGPEAAQDLTQGYFALLLEKHFLQDVKPSAGRFRSFLLASLKHFLSNERDKARALKRGGGARTISLDVEAAEERLSQEPAVGLTPEKSFERRWALTVLERVLERLREAWADAGNEAQFESLKDYLTGQGSQTPYREVAAELGMTETAVRGAVYRLRRRLGQLLRSEIAETVATPDEIDDEIRHLLLVIRPWEAAES